MDDYSPRPVPVKYELWYEGGEERVGKTDRVEVVPEADAESVAISLREAVHVRRGVRDLAHCSAANLRVFAESDPDDELSDDDLLRFLLDGAPERLRVIAPPAKAVVVPHLGLVAMRSRSGGLPARPHSLSDFGGGTSAAAGSLTPNSRRESSTSSKRGEPDTVVVFVKTGDSTFPIEVESGAKVEAVKARIKEQEQIPLDQQRLMHAGVELESGRYLYDYNIHQGSELQLMLTLGGSS